MPAIDFGRLLRPRSVAIIGASPNPGALGASVLDNLERHGFSGPIHLVNPRRERIGSRPCLADIADLPEQVDAAVLAIPGPAVLDAVRALARRRVGAAVVFAAGFAEAGEAGCHAQAELAAISAEAGMAVLGPNCLGFVNYIDGIALTFVETPAQRLGSRPGVGIVSQSGAMAVVLGTMLMGRALGISVSISTGNEAATGVEACLEALLETPQTRVIGMIVEHFRDPPRFLALARRARAEGRTLVLLHPGRSAAARQSAATHTGALAGDWAVMRAIVAEAGVLLADTLEELGDLIEISLRCPRPRPGGTAVLAESGAFKALTLDLADAVGLALPAPGPECATALRAALPDFIPITNPADLTAQALVDPTLYGRTLAPLLADPAYAAILLAIIQTDRVTADRKLGPILAALTALAPQKPVLFAGLDEHAAIDPDHVAALRAAGIPYLPTPERAIRALARLQAAAAITDPDPPAPCPLDLPQVRGMVPEYAAKALLGPAGIAFPRGRLVTSLAQARDAAAALGYPVALKIQSAAISHKSDVGGVVLNLTDADALEAGWARLDQAITANCPGVTQDGVLVEAMGARGREMILGARRDPDWGVVLLAGFGGVEAEAMRDIVLIAPARPEAAMRDTLHGLRAAALFGPFRGAPARDLPALVAMLRRLGAVMRGNPRIREIDLNPVMLHADGAVALDALILLD